MILNRKLSILSVTSELPWPLDTGGKLRTFHIHRALAEEFHVRLIVPVDCINEEHVGILRQHGIHAVPVVTGGRNTFSESFKALQSALYRLPYVLYRRHDHAKVKKQILASALETAPDVLYLDHLDSHLYRNLLPACPAILDLHNVYSLIVERYAIEQSNPLKKFYFQHETKLLQSIERSLADTICTIFAVSDSEVQFYQKLGVRSVQLIPNGVDCSQFAQLPCGRNASQNKLLFLGTMSWGPNAEAASVLIEQIFPEVKRQRPDAELWIVGRNPPSQLLKHHEVNGVHVTGGVPDIVPYYKNADMLVVPLESGGGTRLKILEAFAAGLPVISTPIGVEGINAQCNVHLVITHREQFAKTILDMMNQPQLGQQLSINARKLVEEQYDWKSIGKQAARNIHLQLQAARA
jgi:glycosyltransferase involved in cell wall biosynthesis